MRLERKSREEVPKTRSAQWAEPDPGSLEGQVGERGLQEGHPPAGGIEGEDGGGQAGASAIAWAGNLVAQSRGLALEKVTRGWVHYVLRQKNQQDVVLDGIKEGRKREKNPGLGLGRWSHSFEVGSQEKQKRGVEV